MSAAVSAGGIRPKHRLISIGLVVALATLVAIPLVALWHAFGPQPAEAPDFTFTDQDGRPFTLSASRGRETAVFFGYTHCPDACPTTLAHLAKAVRAPGVPRDVRVLFITVDPKRDTPAMLKRYLNVFDPAFVGLTGTLRELDPVYSAYHTWRVELPVNHGPDNYFMAHGTTIYFLGRDGAVKGFGDWKDDVATLIHDLKEYQ